MTKNIKISVIIPCYNNKSELLLTLYSLREIQEEYFTTEVIIVDGSKKKLMEEEEASDIIKETKKNIIKTTYINGPDSGPYDAMNKGINVIKKDTTWIWFLNSGDEALSAPSELALSTKLEVIIGGWYGKKNKSRLMIPSKDMGLTMSRRSMIGHGICHQAMLFKYKNYDRRVFRWEKYKYAAELDYYIDAILQGGYLVDNCYMPL